MAPGDSQPAQTESQPPSAAQLASEQASASSPSAAAQSAPTTDGSEPASSRPQALSEEADQPAPRSAQGSEQQQPPQSETPTQPQQAANRTTTGLTVRSTATASVAFVPSDTTPAASEAQSGPEPMGQRSTFSFASKWRWPSEPGKLPAYVRRAFRLKAYSLVFAQLSLALAGSVIVSEMNESSLLNEAMMSSSSFWTLCAVSVVCIVALYYYKQVYPCNYILLAVNTVTISLTWSFGGMAGVLFKEETHLHLQVLAILVLAIFVTAMLGHVLSLCKMESELLVPFSFFIGWLTASMANLFFLMANRDTFENTAFVAAGITFLLYGIVLIDVGGKLISGNPDNFMRIVVAFDSTMLVITSIPFLVLSFCLVRSFKHAEERQQANAQQEIGGLPRGGVPNRMGVPARLPATTATGPPARAANRPPRSGGNR